MAQLPLILHSQIRILTNLLLKSFSYEVFVFPSHGNVPIRVTYVFQQEMFFYTTSVSVHLLWMEDKVPQWSMS